MTHTFHNQLLLEVGRSHSPGRDKITNLVKFIKHYVIYHLGISRQITYDNGAQFISRAYSKLFDKFRIWMWLYQHAIHLQMSNNSIQQEFFETSSEVFDHKSTRLWWEVKGMPVGLLHKGENLDESISFSLIYWCKAIL